MVTLLEAYATEEQHSVVWFLWAKGLGAKDIHKDLLTDFPLYVILYLLPRFSLFHPRIILNDMGQVKD
jgi:hypothetical protein